MTPSGQSSAPRRGPPPEDGSPEPERLLSFRTWLVLALGLCVGLFLMLVADGWFDERHQVPTVGPEPAGEEGIVEVEVPVTLADPVPRQAVTDGSGGSTVQPGRHVLHFSAEADGTAFAGIYVLELALGLRLGPSGTDGSLDVGALHARKHQALSLVVFGAGTLTRRLSYAGGDEQVTLRRDVFTVPLQVRTRFPVGREPRPGRRFHLELAHPGGKPIDGASIPTVLYGADRTIPEELRRAWLEHRLLATVDSGYLVFDQHPVAQVLHSGGLPLQLPELGGTLRFAEDGAYTLRAWTDDGYVAELGLDLRSEANAALTLEFRAGETLDVRLSDPEGRPVTQGHVYLLFGPDRSPQHAVVDADGRARFTGLFVEGGVRLRAEASGYRDEERPLPSFGPPVELRMLPLPKVEVDLVVVERGSGQPVAGAEVRLDSDKGLAAEGRTDARGVIRLPFYDGETQRLSVLGRGFHQWIEIVDREAGGEVPRTVELLPEDPARLVALGLACRILGRASGAKGGVVKLAAQGMGLQAPGVASRRRVVTGLRLVERSDAGVDDEGRFELVTDRSGPAVLYLEHDGEQSSQVVELTPGVTLEPVF